PPRTSTRGPGAGGGSSSPPQDIRVVGAVCPVQTRVVNCTQVLLRARNPDGMMCDVAQFKDDEYEQFLQMAINSTGPRYSAAQTRPRLLQPDRPGEHVWVLMATYRVSTEYLTSGDGPMYIDAENLALAEIGCWVCATHWNDRQDDRVCPGNPQEQLMKALTDMMIPRCPGCE